MIDILNDSNNWYPRAMATLTISEYQQCFVIQLFKQFMNYATVRFSIKKETIKLDDKMWNEWNKQFIKYKKDFHDATIHVVSFLTWENKAFQTWIIIRVALKQQERL